ncbi:MAG: transglycosylase domain-containing protein [Bacillota bacterium]
MAAVLLIPLPEPNNPEVTEILDLSGEPIERRFEEDRVEIPVARMPKHLLHAIVSIEDDRFYRHRGIDPIGIGRALLRNLRAGRVLEGGSTLTQQLARNLSFGEAPLGQKRTLTRKLLEALIALKLEYKYSKEQILGLYWNTIYLGHRAYGLERAAQTYFGKSIRAVPEDQPLNLTLAEAALLAALPQSPEYYTSDLDGARRDLLARRDKVLDKMVEQGYIRQAEAEAVKKERKVEFHFERGEGKERHLGHTVPYFIDYVMHELEERYPEVAANLNRGGYRIFTTLDPKLQAAAEAAVAEGLREIKAGRNEEPEIALVAVDPSNGHVRALIGGREPRVERNRALLPRQPGSTFKPFVYATALSTHSYVVTSTQLDTPREFPGREPGKPWVVTNWEGKSSNQPETMRSALKRSLNTVTVAWMNILKPRPVIETARKVGLEAEYDDNLTIGLGTEAVSPLQITTAFAALANGGDRVRPMAVLRVEDHRGNVLASQEPVRETALEPGVAFIVTDMLKEVLGRGGTGSRGGSWLGGWPAAGKSGTTDDSVDAWFVGYTPSLVAGVWTGYDDRRETTLLGGQDVSPIWGRFMSKAITGQRWQDWKPPAGVVATEVCTITGLRPNASCPVGKEWYLAGTAPDKVDTTVHWDQVVPELPGVPWAPPGLLPPMPGPAEETEPGPPATEPDLSPPAPPLTVPPSGAAPPGLTEPAIRAPDAPPELESEPEEEPEAEIP